MPCTDNPGLVKFGGDATLSALLNLLEAHADRPLVLRHTGRDVGAGYHVTEVKAASFVALDCGGHPDAWEETVFQIEDLPGDPGAIMSAGKFRSILARVADRVRLQSGSRVTFEIGRPREPMQVFDVSEVAITITL